MDQAKAEQLADKLAGGHWTHDYALTAKEARELGLPVTIHRHAPATLSRRCRALPPRA